MVAYAGTIIYHYRGPPPLTPHEPLYAPHAFPAPSCPPIYVNASNGKNLYGQTQNVFNAALNQNSCWIALTNLIRLGTLGKVL